MELHKNLLHEEEHDMKQLTDFTKNCIFQCYNLMRDCTDTDNIENTEFIYSVFRKIERYKVTIPMEIYNNINNFVEETLYPIVDDPDFFSSTTLPEYGSFDEERGSFVVNSEESLKKIMISFFQISIDMERKVDDFAMKHLRPYLI